MAAKDLITVARAKLAIQSITDSSQDGLLSALVTSYSDAIEKYCRRRFVSHFYDELYNGNGERRLLLRQYPVQSVQSVRYRLVVVLFVTNGDQLLNQQARIAVTSTGLLLTAMQSGVPASWTVTFAANPTLNALAAAINALGNGWSAQVEGDVGSSAAAGDYGLWPSADLYVPGSYGDSLEGAGILQSQGAQNARGCFAELRMHTYELEGYQWDARGWLLRAIPYTDPELMHPEDLCWPVGSNNFRIQYTAGYTTIPEAVQEACAQWVAEAYYQTLRDPGLAAQAIPGQLTQSWGVQPVNVFDPPPRVARLLAPYRRITVTTNQG
jgi:hypothetical protein